MILVLILISGFKREIIPLPGCGTPSPTMSWTPTSPGFHIFSIPFGSLELSGWVLTTSTTGFTTIASIVFTQILVSDGRHQMSYLLCECFIWWVRVSHLHLQSWSHSHYSRFRPWPQKQYFWVSQFQPFVQPSLIGCIESQGYHIYNEGNCGYWA